MSLISQADLQESISWVLSLGSTVVASTQESGVVFEIDSSDLSDLLLKPKKGSRLNLVNDSGGCKQLAPDPSSYLVVSNEQNFYTVRNSRIESTAIGYNDDIIEAKFNSNSKAESPFLVVVTNSSLARVYHSQTRQFISFLPAHTDILLCC